MSKAVNSLKEAIKLCGLKDGMRISGDRALSMVLDEIADMGHRDITVNAGFLYDAGVIMMNHIKNNVVTALEISGIGAVTGREISKGILNKPVDFRSFGGRTADIESGKIHIDIAFIAASASDNMGNCTGKYGSSSFGSSGCAFADAMHADKVVVITDNLVDYPLYDFSISEVYVDYVVCVDKIGEDKEIIPVITKITKNDVDLVISSHAAKVIQHSGLLQNGFSFHSDAAGVPLAVVNYLKELMLKENIKGSFCMGGITGCMVDMLESGCFEALMDVRSLDLKAVESIRENKRHREVTESHYATIFNKLDVAVLSAVQVDTSFNVNVHTDYNGYIIGGSGGHCDAAEGAKLTVIAAPLIKIRLPLIEDRALCISTPGKAVDVLVTERGIAVNPLRDDLSAKLKEARLPVMDIHELKDAAEKITGVPKSIKTGEKIVGNVIHHDGTITDIIKNI